MYTVVQNICQFETYLTITSYLQVMRRPYKNEFLHMMISGLL